MNWTVFSNRKGNLTRSFPLEKGEYRFSHPLLRCADAHKQDAVGMGNERACRWQRKVTILYHSHWTWRRRTLICLGACHVIYLPERARTLRLVPSVCFYPFVKDKFPFGHDPNTLLTCSLVISAISSKWAREIRSTLGSPPQSSNLCMTKMKMKAAAALKIIVFAHTAGGNPGYQFFWQTYKRHFLNGR